MSDKDTQNLDCWNCKFFRISHEKSFPYKCLAMKFKSASLPCIEVIKIEGDRCLSFVAK